MNECLQMSADRKLIGYACERMLKRRAEEEEEEEEGEGGEGEDIITRFCDIKKNSTSKIINNIVSKFIELCESEKKLSCEIFKVLKSAVIY